MTTNWMAIPLVWNFQAYLSSDSNRVQRWPAKRPENANCWMLPVQAVCQPRAIDFQKRFTNANKKGQVVHITEGLQ